MKCCAGHGTYFGEACAQCEAERVERDKAQRDADRAQWRRYAEAALGSLLGGPYADSCEEGWEKSLAHECSLAADAMLAADKAKWGE